MHRVVVAGGPRVGKSTLAKTLSIAAALYATDDLVGKDVDAVAEVASWLTRPGPWVIEGVMAVRALRRWLADNAAGLPCDCVYWSSEPKVEQTKGQRTMAKGCATVWTQIESELRARGVVVHAF